MNLDFGSQADAAMPGLGTSLAAIFGRILATFQLIHAILFLPYGMHVSASVSCARAHV
jgi:hypothetical protein